MKPLILLMILSLAAQSQTTPRKKAPARPAPPPAEQTVPDKWRLDELTVQGTKVYPAAKILGIAGMKTGTRVGKPEFEAARDRLLASGFFETVGFHFDPVPGQPAIRGSFDVVEIAQVYRWRVDDLPITTAEFAKLLAVDEPLVGEKLPASDVVMKRLAGRLQNAVLAKGFTGPVSVQIVTEAAQNMVVIFRPKQTPPNIAEVNFVGNKAVSTGDLRRTIANLAIGSPFTEARFREYLATTIIPMYENVGRLRVTFPKITNFPAGDVRGVGVKVEVNEGPAYDLGDVEVRGTPYTPAQIERTAHFKSGQVANFTEIGQSIDAVLRELKDNGYLRPTQQVTRNINDEKKVVDLIVDVTPGDQYTFGKLDINGLDIETEPVIRKMWGLRPGAPFPASYPQVFLDRVRSEGIFDNLGETKSQQDVNDERHTVNVRLIFKGAGPGPGRQRPHDGR